MTTTFTSDGKVALDVNVVNQGSGASEVEVTNFPATQPVSGTVTVSGLATAGSTQQGAIANAAYTDATGAANGTMIALLKGIFVQLAEINAKTPAA